MKTIRSILSAFLAGAIPAGIVCGLFWGGAVFGRWETNRAWEARVESRGAILRDEPNRAWVAIRYLTANGTVPSDFTTVKFYYQWDANRNRVVLTLGEFQP